MAILSNPQISHIS